MLTEVVPVVGGEDEIRILELPERGKFVDDGFDSFIDSLQRLDARLVLAVDRSDLGRSQKGRLLMARGLSLTSASLKEGVRGACVPANIPLWRGAGLAGPFGTLSP